MDTPLELAKRTWRTSEGYPLASHTEGSGKRTHLHTTLNKSRDERTDTATLTTAGLWAPLTHQREWFEIQFSAWIWVRIPTTQWAVCTQNSAIFLKIPRGAGAKISKKFTSALIHLVPRYMVIETYFCNYKCMVGTPGSVPKS